MMDIYTFSVSDAAGMIARLDAEGGAGQVLVVGSSLRESNELVEALFDDLLARAVPTVIRKPNGNLELELLSGIKVRAISGAGARGRSARLGILIPGVKPNVVRDVQVVVHGMGGSLIAVNLPAPVEPTPEKPEPESDSHPTPRLRLNKIQHHPNPPRLFVVSLPPSPRFWRVSTFEGRACGIS
ncbi:hypothetical protein ACXR2W_00845 [Leucobacter sp. HY1908]